MAAILRLNGEMPDVRRSAKLPSRRTISICSRTTQVPGAEATGLAENNLSENVKIRRPLTWGARLWLALTLTMAAAVLANAAIYWHSPDLIKFGAFLAISLISAGARVRVPGVTELLPLSYFFVLLRPE